MFFMSWGTKTRVRSQGDRAEFCPGCLQPTRFTVKKLLSANHLYGIALGYSHNTMFGECNICGATIEPMFDHAVVPVGTLSYQSLLEKTNPRLTPERIEVLCDVGGDPESRVEQSLRYFLTKQDAVLKKEQKTLGGGSLFVLLASLVLVLCAFIAGGFYIGMACTILGIIVTGLVHRIGVHYRAAREIRPNLRRFLYSQRISFDELEQKLEANKFSFSKLKRHLTSGKYDAIRMESLRSSCVPDDIANLFLTSQAQAS